jgi:hypothetical protein
MDPHARLRKRRRERLLALLPRIYGTQPEGSVVATLLDALAGQLAELDVATERVLRDRWVALAGDTSRWDSGPHPLEQLGALMDVTREPWEEEEAFRRRLSQVAPVLARGSATVRSVLTLAAAGMDAELCRRLTRLPEGDESIQDTTLSIGVKPGTVARCAGCSRPGARCIYENDRGPRNPVVARLLLTDNPVTPRSLRVSRVTHGAGFQVRNPSLAADRPVLVLRVLKVPAGRDAVEFPALRNVAGREVMVYAGRLSPGQTLTIVPRRSAEEARPFEGHSPEGPALQRRMAPEGGAYVLEADGRRTDVSRQVLYLRADVFDEARFMPDELDPGASRFALLGRALLTPRVDAGESAWAYQGYTRADIAAVATEELADVLAVAPPESRAGEVELTLSWFTRPPATFRVRIPEMPFLTPEALPRVRELVQRLVASARAAGVRVSVDFPEPPRQETHEQSEAPLGTALAASFAETLAMREALDVKTAVGFGEVQPQEETRVSMGAVLDMTRLDWSHLP